MIHTTLDALQIGQSATVTSLTATGSMRRRLLDIGLTEGTQVKLTAIAPSGDPKAFSIKGAIIAIRRDDCKSIQIKAAQSSLNDGMWCKKREPSDRIIALAGNPNVGKSTIFNALTGMHQHTGNWPGKTVGCTQGYFNTEKNGYVLVDIPGTYSLYPHSAEEEAASGFLSSGTADAAVVVCDATCLERSLNLALQIMQKCRRTIICVNLMDEAEKRHISIDLKLLEKRLGVPVVGTSARDKASLKALTEAIDKVCATCYDSLSEGAPPAILSKIPQYASLPEGEDITSDMLHDRSVAAIYKTAHEICSGAVIRDHRSDISDRRMDSILTSKAFGYPLMVLLLLGVFWLTITGANYPSQLLSGFLNSVGAWLSEILISFRCPEWLRAPLIDGAWQVLAWVVGVMLPPMAIFFPLFSLLEDSGYLPRVAFCLDSTLKKCHACGKQALTMAMGFGCNAVGVTGCRIIDSKRERLIAMLTNSLVPCNGRFPAIIAIITMFFISSEGGIAASLGSAALLTLIIMLGIGMTFLASRILSATILKGEPSSFTLELPPYRRPQIGKVILRSVFDRTIFVLARAAAVAAPAGLIIWLCANVTIGDATILSHCTEFLDPFARLLGIDGVILTAFILGLPANEIVIPIIIMTYMAQGSLTELDATQMHELFIANGWTPVTAISTILFSLMHWPCSTTLLTIKKESGGWKWAAAAILLPTVMGMIVCFIFTTAAHAMGIQ